MRILQVTPVFYPALAYGGVVRVAFEFSKRLAQKGHEVIVVTTDANKGSRITEDHNVSRDGLNIFYFKNISNLLAWKCRLFLPIGLTAFFCRDRFDIIHIHDFRTIHNILTYYYAKKNEIPYILQPHGSLTSNIDKKDLKKLYDILFGYKIIRGASKILALNETEAKKCQDIGIDREKIIIISNGINLEEYKNLPTVGEFKNKYGIQEKIVLYTGRVEKSKGLELLIEAFYDLSKEIDKVKLVIVGPDDGYLSTLEDLINHMKIKDKILVTGFISERDKIAAYVDADVFVTPSFYGLPITFLEAMACKVPIVTTNRGDHIDWIDKFVGLTVQYNRDELKNAIKKILLDDDFRNMLIRNAKAKSKTLDWDSLTTQIESIYQSIVLS